MNALTPSQAAAFGFIVRFIDQHGYPPTIRELMQWNGTTSTNNIRDLLRALVKKGYIQHDTFTARGIRPLCRDMVVEFKEASSSHQKSLQAQARELQPAEPKELTVCPGEGCKECGT